MKSLAYASKVGDSLVLAAAPHTAGNSVDGFFLSDFQPFDFIGASYPGLPPSPEAMADRAWLATA